MSRPPVLAVQAMGTTVAATGEQLPTVVIDAGDHPAITDLARVHAVEGIGDITTSALVIPTATGHQMLLGVKVTTPVRCSFALVFELPEHRLVLDQALQAEQLVIATTDPVSAHVDQPLWLAIDLDATLLADTLP